MTFRFGKARWIVSLADVYSNWVFAPLSMRDELLKIQETEIADSFAEAFSMRFTRLIVTAHDSHWLDAGLREFCGYGTSVISCDAEVGIENRLTPTETPDGRVGASVLLFAFDSSSLEKAVTKRCGQCLMTCPTTAVFNGLETKERIQMGQHLRFFGDGFQKSKLIGDCRYWRIPVMDGEFLIEESAGIAKGVAGGNFLIESVDQVSGLKAARKSVEAIESMSNVITPFPGGVVRSGSKVGSKYKGMVASTSDKFCPTLKGRVASEVHPEANCIYEIVIDGTDFESVRDAICTGIKAATMNNVVRINAGNYGGKLGKHHFYLRQILENS